MKKSEFIFSVLLVPVDYLMLLIAGFVTYNFRTQILGTFRPVAFEVNLSFERYMTLVVIVSMVFILTYAISGLYSLRTTRTVVEEFFKIIVASSAGLMAIIVYIFLRSELFDSRFLVLGGWIMAIIFVSAGRYIMRKIQKELVIRRDFGVHRVLVIGVDEVSNSIVKEMQDNKGAGYVVVKQIANPDLDQIQKTNGIDEVILADPNFPSERVQEIVDFCYENHYIFRFVPNMHNTLTSNFSIDTFTGVPLVELRRTKLDGWGRVAKRSLDIIISALGLVVLSPFFAILSIIIKLDSKGTVFYGSKRMSTNKEIIIYKFRSMYQGADEIKDTLRHLNERKDGPMFKIKNDPRVTSVGRFIRRTRIDEFPQLFNVLIGDMSLVGPRPHLLEEIAQYKKHHKRVLAIKSGVTGMAQISGSSDLPFEEEVAIDTLYIENWTFVQDIKILIFTMLKLFRDKSAT